MLFLLFRHAISIDLCAPKAIFMHDHGRNAAKSATRQDPQDSILRKAKRSSPSSQRPFGTRSSAMAGLPNGHLKEMRQAIALLLEVLLRGLQEHGDVFLQHGFLLKKLLLEMP